MRGTELLDAMEHLDEDLVEEADQPPAAKKSVPFKKILASAACLAGSASRCGACWSRRRMSRNAAPGAGRVRRPARLTPLQSAAAARR